MTKLNNRIAAAALFFALFYALPAGAESMTFLGQTIQTDSLNGFMQLAVALSKWILGITGSLALAAFVYGGFVWMLSAGNAQNVEKGKGILKGAVIGLIIVFASYSIIQFVLKTSGVTDGSGNLTGFGGQKWDTTPK